MSLVDYASDEDDSHDSDGEEREHEKNIPEASEIGPLTRQPQKVPQTVCEHSQDPTPPTRPSIEKLPDASLLLNSPDISSHIFTGSNYASRVKATMFENASRKRAANASPGSSTQAKLPKGASSLPRDIGARKLLVPPQLSGRSNVVTEDISKLFVKRQASADNQPSE